MITMLVVDSFGMHTVGCASTRLSLCSSGWYTGLISAYLGSCILGSILGKLQKEKEKVD